MPPTRPRAGIPPRPSRPYRVFVSHATADKWVARTICEQIEAIPGLEAFRDDRDIGGGNHIPKVIWAEIRADDELLVLLTPTAITRIWVGMEIGMAYARGKLIVPIWYNTSVTAVSLFANVRGYQLESFADYLTDLQGRARRRKR
jgi:hypothetical protein